MVCISRATFYAVIFLGVLVLVSPLKLSGDERVIEIIADKDARYKVPGQRKPVIVARPGEILQLRITSRRGPAWQKNGLVHRLTFPALKDQGWDFPLPEGTHEFTVVVPKKPGKYEGLCTVYCGPGHAEMRMKLIVRETAN